MMADPLVSIVVPCYNYGRYLPECLESIFRQDSRYDLEVIAVDDASPDNSGEILRNWPDGRLRIITHDKNLGHAATVTDGIQAARGKYVARIDPDDRYRPEFLATLVPILESNPEVGMTYGDAAMIDAAGRLTAPRSDEYHGDKDFLGNELVALMERHFICAPTALGRREAWLGALPIPPHLAFNDVWFNLMIARHWDYCYKQVVVADYRVHSENWHRRTIRDRSDEHSILWLLETLFLTPEKNPEREVEKHRARPRIYGAHYLLLARHYFGAGMMDDAQRCYLHALRNRPSLLLNPQIARQLTATFMGRKLYESIKMRWRSL